MRRSDFTLKCISAVLLIAIACYIGFYFLRSSSDLTQTSRAVIVTAGESTMTTGYIVRDEQILSGGGFYLGILPVVFGCAVGTITFFLVNLIEWKQGVEAAPSAYIGE